MDQKPRKFTASGFFSEKNIKQMSKKLEIMKKGQK
jgi:hypothetical protein